MGRVTKGVGRTAKPSRDLVVAHPAQPPQPPALVEETRQSVAVADALISRGVGLGALALGVLELVSPPTLAIDLSQAFVFLGVGAVAASGQGNALAKVALRWLAGTVAHAGAAAKVFVDKQE